MDNHTEQIVNTLMREYELHKQELLLQIDLYNRQTKYIQVYGAILFGLLAFIFRVSPKLISKFDIGNGISVAEQFKESMVFDLPAFVIPMLLIFAAAIIFYLVSTIMSSSYMFLIIRGRMAEIEDKVNTLLGEPGLLSYETKITPHFLEENSYGVGLFTPHALSGIWRVFLFFSVIGILIGIAVEKLPTPWGYVYSIIVGYISLFLSAQYYALYKRGKRYIKNFYRSIGETESQISLFSAFWLFLGVGLLYMILVTITYSYPTIGKNLYGILFRNIFQANDFLIAFYIFVYEIFCAIFLFTPSEAPILLSKAPVLLYPRLSFLTIIIISALGKGFGAWIVCKWLDILEKLFKHLHLHRFFSPKTRIKNYLASKGFIAYFLMQAIPFMPMRSSIYVYSFISRNGAKVAIGAAIGTIFRNLLMLLLIWFGYISAKTLFLK